MKKNKGFTLIELLVVIAIIGILAGILFVSLNPSKQTKEADDSNIKTAVDGMRFGMTDYFTRNDFSYENAADDEKIKKVLDSVNGMVLESDSGNWAVKAPLNNGKEFCRDSTGNASEKENQDISDFLCD